MKAIVLRSKGNASQLRLEDAETPKINDSEVLVRVKAASVNHLDIWLREGQLPVSYPLIPGCEGAGDVAEVGKNVQGFRKGDRVLIMPSITCGKCDYCIARNDNMCRSGRRIGINVNGCYAEYVKAPSQNLLPISTRVGYEESASIPITFGTAYRSLNSLAKIVPGETVLINAAGSGVGTAAIQIAKLAGAKVIATAGSDEKLRKAKLLGADYAINYRKISDFDLAVNKMTNGKGVDAAIEQVGGEVLCTSLKCLRKGGRMVILGTTSGSTAEIDIQYIYRNNLTLLGTSGVASREVIAAFRLLEAGKVKPVIDRTFQLKDAAKAHRYMEERKNFGKIILKP